MEDIWSHIAKFIPKGSWKNFIFTCKLFSSFNTLNEVRKRANHIKTLLKFYPYEDWDYNELVRNRKLSIDYLLTLNLDQCCNGLVVREDWSYDYVINNPTLPWIPIVKAEARFKDVLAHQEVDWDYENLSYSKNIDWDIIAILKTRPWDWEVLSETLNDINVLLKYPDLPWHWNRLEIDTRENRLRYPHLPWLGTKDKDFAYAEFEIESYDNKDMHNLSCYNGLDPDLIIKHPYKKWVFTCLSCNESVPMSFIIKYKYLDWDWELVSKRKDLTLDMIKMDIPWNIKELSFNKSLSYEDMKRSGLSWSPISLILKMDVKDIDELLTEPCGDGTLLVLSLNPNVTFDMVTKEWNFRHLSGLGNY